MAQKEDPKNGDWYSEMNYILTEYKMNILYEKIMKMPSNIFKGLVKKETFSASLTYLKSKQKKGETQYNYRSI